MQKYKETIEELELKLKSKEEEIQRLKKTIEDMENKKEPIENVEKSAFDMLFEPYDYFAKDE